MDITKLNDEKLKQELAMRNVTTMSATSLAKFIRQCVKDSTEEIQTILDAWQNVFGTTQLSHAQERLRVAEDNQKKLLNILKRIISSTPHSMCSDAKAWAEAEQAIASVEGKDSHVA